MPVHESGGGRRGHDGRRRRGPARARLVPLPGPERPPASSRSSAAVGNAAVGRLLQRRVTMTSEGDVPAAPVTGIGAWSEDEVRTIQRELSRLNLYNLNVDGDPGARTEVSLSEAFGNDTWRTMTATEVTEALRAAEKPWAGEGPHAPLRRAVPRRRPRRHVRRRLLRVLGQGAATPPRRAWWPRPSSRRSRSAATRRTPRRPPSCSPPPAGRSPTPTTGRFFVKENAFTYAPPAGESRAIHSIVRVVSNEVAGGGAAAAAAFREGMATGDAAWYSGHGRYGTGPDFDRNFIEFRLRDADGTLEQTLDDYDALEHVLAKGGKDPWKVFQQRVADGTLEVDLSNAGNIRHRRPRPQQRVRRQAHQLGARQDRHEAPDRRPGPARGGRREELAAVPRARLLRLLDQLLRQGAARHGGLQHEAGRHPRHQPRHPRRGGRRRLHVVPRQPREPDARPRRCSAASTRRCARTSTATPATPGSSPAPATTPGSEHARARTEPRRPRRRPRPRWSRALARPHRDPRAAAHDRQRRGRAAAAAPGDRDHGGRRPAGRLRRLDGGRDPRHPARDPAAAPLRHHGRRHPRAAAPTRGSPRRSAGPSGGRCRPPRSTSACARPSGPPPAAASALRSAELFTDGVLDVTFGVGFIEQRDAQPDERDRRAA